MAELTLVLILARLEKALQYIIYETDFLFSPGE